MRILPSGTPKAPYSAGRMWMTTAAFRPSTKAPPQGVDPNWGLRGNLDERPAFEFSLVLGKCAPELSQAWKWSPGEAR